MIQGREIQISTSPLQRFEINITIFSLSAFLPWSQMSLLTPVYFFWDCSVSPRHYYSLSSLDEGFFILFYLHFECFPSETIQLWT